MGLNGTKEITMGLNGTKEIPNSTAVWWEMTEEREGFKVSPCKFKSNLIYRLTFAFLSHCKE